MYKVASRYFQRFKEATGRVAFNLRVPLKRESTPSGEPAPPHDTNLTFSKWMRLFLSNASSAKNEIILVSPSIKLTLVRPLLLALSGGGVSLTVATVINKSAFRASSELEALELLQGRPGVTGLTRIFELIRPHPSVYIFDRTVVLLGPSVHTLPNIKGFYKRRLITSPPVVRDVVAELERLLLSSPPVTTTELSVIRRTLLTAPELFGGAPAAAAVASHTVELEATSVDSGMPVEDEIGRVLMPQDAAERASAMDDFVEHLRDRSLNSLRGEPFESPSVEKSQPELWREAANRDLERIRSAVANGLHLDRNVVDEDAIVAPFVHQYWCDMNMKEVLSHGFQGQYFSSLGREAVALEISLHFTRQIGFDNVSSAPAATATHALLGELEYESYLDSMGLRSLLSVAHEVSQPANLAAGQFHAVLGLLYHYGQHETVRGYLRRVLTGELELQEIRDSHVDAKTLLQNFTQLDGRTPTYECTHEGPAHRTLFTAQVKVGRQQYGSGTGNSRKEAELAAAAATLEEFEKRPDFGAKLERALGFMRPKEARLLPYSLSGNRAEGCGGLARYLGVNFGRRSHLVDHALTHSSFVLANPKTRSSERLAFPGSYLTNMLIINDAIGEFGWRIPGGAKDAVQRRRRCMNTVILPKAFKAMGLEKLLRADTALTASRESVMADSVQALLAAVYEAEGMSRCQEVWARWVRPHVAEASNVLLALDAVTELQEVTQDKYKKVPDYIQEKDPKRPPHKPRYFVSCFVEGLLLAKAEGSSIKAAKQAAARQAIAKLKSL